MNNNEKNQVNEEEILEFLSKINKHGSFRDLSFLFNFREDEEKKELTTVLDRMVSEGKILQNKKGYLPFPRSSNLHVGELRLTSSGNGFVDNIFIDKKDLFGACEGDTVMVEQTSGFNEKEKGVVRKILKRNRNFLPFTYSNGQLIPYLHKLQFGLTYDPKILEGLENGDRVGIKISKELEDNCFEILEMMLISKKDDPSIDYKTIPAKNGFNYNFTNEELEEVNKKPTSVSNDELIGRKDFRDEQVITIDGEKTKDMDDAISCQKVGDNYVLRVHISDVGHYIKRGSALYERAKRNSQSLYLMNEVFYMLHPKIANGICSLNEGSDRLTLSATVTLSNEGDIVDYDFDLGVINSKKKTTYEESNKYLDEGQVVPGYEPYLELLDTAKELSDKLSKKREKNGYLEFASTEPDFTVDEDGKIISIKNMVRGSSEKIIENFMILVDYCYADYMNWMNAQYIKRVHDYPDEKKVSDIIDFINTLGYKVRKVRDVSDPRALKAVMDQLKDVEEFPILSDLLLRSMKKAGYSLDNIGHYGLGAQYHSHFTAPIRRVVDLENHHLMRDILLNENNHEYSKKELAEMEKNLAALALHASTCEKKGNDAEREAQKMEMASLMEDKVGEYFNGRVTNMNMHGAFVRTCDGINGYVRLEDVLNGTYKYDPKTKTILLKDGRQVRVSDAVRMKLVKASKEERAIDFKITELLKKSPKTKIKGVKKQ